MKDNTKRKTPRKRMSDKFPGYPPYPVQDDIFNHDKEESDINPEDISKPKSKNEEDLTKERSGDNLDVPGSELDDQQEDIGSEDEENNYYSLGGDNHDD